MGSLALAHEPMMKGHYRWCRKNWQECKQRMLSHMEKRMECLQEANSFEEFRACMRKAMEKPHEHEGK